VQQQVTIIPPPKISCGCGPGVDKVPKEPFPCGSLLNYEGSRATLSI